MNSIDNKESGEIENSERQPRESNKIQTNLNNSFF